MTMRPTPLPPLKLVKRPSPSMLMMGLVLLVLGGAARVGDHNTVSITVDDAAIITGGILIAYYVDRLVTWWCQ